MEKQRKKYKHFLDDNISNQESFKSPLTLPLIKLDMVELVFNQLRIKNQDLELEELFNYYENMFIKKFPSEIWNYYNTENHRTNNSYENYNKTLNSYFNSKPTII